MEEPIKPLESSSIDLFSSFEEEDSYETNINTFR